jgi:nitrous oxidase accessory protein
MSRLLERGFAAVSVLVLVVAVLGAAVPSGGAQPTAEPTAVDSDVPDEFTFTDVETPGVATVGGRSFDSLQAAVDAASPGDTVRLRGRFTERVVVSTPDVTLSSAPGALAVLDGGGAGTVLTLDGANVTVRRLWVRNAGFDTAQNDAAIWVNSSGGRVLDSRVTDTTFGIWVDGVDGVTLANNTIVGREAVRPLSYRGNGIQLWKTADSVVRDNRITDVRDGIYYSWASAVVATNNTMWELRYGVHYMYSDDCTLADNLAFDNDVGYALMLSERLTVVGNRAVNNTGTSGHGILLKRIDHSVVSDNAVVGNGRGLYVYNALDDTITRNLVLGNRVGVHLAAGSVDGRVQENSFIDNDLTVLTVTNEQVAWNGSARGNYWADARVIDRDRDGVSEVRYRPAGTAEHLLATHPQATAFAHSPAFDAIRLAESAFPVLRRPGVVDHHPLAASPHDTWRRYYDRDTRN